MAIDLASASAELRLDVSNFVTNAQRAADAANGIKQATDNATSGSFLGWVTDNKKALNKWGKGLLAVGGIITGAFTAPVIAGSKAAWGQVDAVEQATVAMRAYVDDAEKVDQVLADLVAYARSDLGVLFQRQDLFEAAQSMLIYGASIDEVTGYVEIMSRSVGLGTGNWQDLNRIIGRIGSTGKITRDDFDMLTKAGYQLDSSIVGQTVTWQELFAILDQGIPADALAGQADTIRGKSIRLQSALRGLGLAFLGVDSETSKFIEGGLGWQMMRGMERLRSLFIAAAPAVGRFGDMLAAIGRPLGQVFDWLLRLPQSVQTAMLMFTAGTGVLMTFSGGLLLMLPRIASTVAAFQALGGLSGMLGGVATAIRAIGTASLALFANPVILAGALALGALFAAYKTNFMGFGDAVDHALDRLGSFTDALDILLGKPATKNFEIITTADNAFELWQITEDGSVKHSELDVQLTPTTGADVHTIIDPATGEKSYQLSLTGVDGDQTALDIVESSRSEDNPDFFYLKANVDGSEVEGFYNQVTKEWFPIDNDLIDLGTVQLNADKAIEDMKQLEKAALLVRSVFILARERAREFGEVLSVLRTHFRPVLDFAQNAVRYFNPFNGLMTRLTGTFRTLNNILLGDWGSISWEDIMDAAGLGIVYDTVTLLADGYDRLMSAWNSWNNRASDTPGSGQVFGQGTTPTEATRYIYPVSDRERTLHQPTGSAYADPYRPTEGGARGIEQYAIDSLFQYGEAARQAAEASGVFDESLLDLSLSSLQADAGLMKTASTVPMFTSSTRDADQATGAMAGNMNRSFSDMARSAVTNFTSMQSTATSRASSMQSSVIGSILGMQTRAAAQMALMSSTTGTQTSNMQSTATTNASTMASRVGSHMLGMRTAAALQMGLMASSAATTGSEMNTGMIGWMAGAITRVAANMGLMVGAVRNAAGPGYDAGYYAGSMIGAGMAAGMNAYLGQIRASANAMVAAASQAVVARAMISSPSRLFMQYGEYIGEGLEIGMRNMIPQIGRAASDMIPQPAFNTPIGHGGYGGTTVIDNSTHTETYVALNDQQFAELLAAKDKANIVHDAMTNRHSASQYGGGRR